MNWYRKIISLLESVNTVAYRWVDAKAAKQYIKIDKIVGRTRHWLPKELSGLDKIYPKTGISFSDHPTRWNAHGSDGICFVIDVSKLPNKVAYIDGDAVFRFSQELDRAKSGLSDYEYVKELRNDAIKSSKDKPDETFIIGNIENLHRVLIEVIVRNDKSYDLMKDYCERHNIKLTLKSEIRSGPF